MIFDLLQRYRRGQRGGRGFHRGSHNHFNNRGQTRKTAEGSSGVCTAKTPTTEQNKHENQETTSQNSTRLENREDPLSLVLDGCCNEEDERGLYKIKHFLLLVYRVCEIYFDLFPNI